MGPKTANTLRMVHKHTLDRKLDIKGNYSIEFHKTALRHLASYGLEVDIHYVFKSSIRRDTTLVKEFQIQARVQAGRSLHPKDSVTTMSLPRPHDEHFEKYREFTRILRQDPEMYDFCGIEDSKVRFSLNSVGS